MRGGVKVDTTTRTKVTSIVTRDATAMGARAVVETVGGMGDSVPLINVGEAMGMR